MPLGNTNTQSNKKLYILKIKTKVLDAESGKELPVVPHVFQVTEKVDGKWIARPELINQFKGDLTKIDFDKGEWDGSEYDIVKLYFNDEENQETYLWDSKANSDFRAAANSILSLDPSDTSDITISTYKTTSKKNGKDYSNVGVFQGKTHIKGRFSWDELPKPDDILDKKGNLVKRDTSELDEFVISHLKEFAAQMGKAPKKAKSTSAPAPEPEVDSDPDPDVPF